MLQCYNRGCGQTYDPATNNEESCRHHPGAPFFHDAYKGWSCCNKKSVDFTEFLSIKGCTLSEHSNVKPPEPEKPAKESNVPSDSEEEVQVIRAPIREAMKRPPIDTPMVAISAIVAPALKQAIDELQIRTPSEAAVTTLAPGEVAVGTACKNSGCSYSYTGTSSDDALCTYHPGVPIFHEGMKYWSCCQRKTSDFTVFMAQKGCACGEHKWFKENDDKKVVQCRYDWHQTSSNVIVSIYAKLYHYKQSTIEVNPVRLHVTLVFPDQSNAKFDLDLELRGIVDVTKTTAHMYGSKIEITLPKAEPGSWPKLDFPTTKQPSVQKASEGVNVVKNKSGHSSEDDEGFDLDDIETVNTGLRLSEIGQTKRQF